MRTLIFLSVAVGSYYLMCILQAVLHRTHGHRKRIRAVFQAHALYYYGTPIVFVAAAIGNEKRKLGPAGRNIV